MVSVVTGIGRRGLRSMRSGRLLAVLAVLRLLRRLGVGRAVWRLTPRRLRLLAAGLLACWLLVLAGAVAVVILVVLHAT